MRRGRRCASCPADTRPARSSTLRCFEIAGWLIANGRASSLTDVSPRARRARIARRVGSARAVKTASSRDEAFIFITAWLDNLQVMQLRELRQHLIAISDYRAAVVG